MRLLNETKFVIPVLLFLIFLFSGLLYWVIFLKKNESDSPTIGILTFKSKTVLRKYNDAVVWDQIETKSPVKNRDTIRTEGLSDATLTLNDGTQIKISENSMILLDLSDKNININFAYGSFEAAREGSLTSESKLNIQSGDQKIEVGKGEVKLDKSKSELNIQVESGEAKVSSNGVENTVGKNEVANVNNEGVRVSKSVFTFESPEDKKNYLSNSGKEQILFRIGGINPSSIRENKPELEVSLFPDFSKIFVSEKISKSSFNKNLPVGSYYYRIKYLEAGKKNNTGIGRFRIINDPPLRILSPNEGDTFNYTGALPVIRVSWNLLDLYSNYTVQIAKDTSFAGSDLISKQTQGQSIAFDSLTDGVYFLRISAKSFVPGVNEKLSNVAKFVVTKKTNTEPPELLEPQKGKTLFEEQTKSSVFFSWKDNRDYESYVLEVAKDSEFKSLVVSEATKSNFFKFKGGLDVTSYFWRVKAKLTNGQTLESKIHNFTIVSKENLELLSPAPNSDVNPNEDGVVVLKWKKLIQKTDYIIEIAKTSDFSNPITSGERGETYFEFKAKDFGKYYWRVKSASSGGVVSETRGFNLESNMEPPVLLTPVRNESIDIVQKNAVLFTWKPSEKAVAYRIKLFDVSGIKEKLVFSERVIGIRYNFTEIQKLNAGRFRWEVASLFNTSTGERESSYLKQDFFILVPELKIPKILSPGTIYVE